MKILLLYLLFSPLYALAQVAIYNVDLIDSTKHQLFHHLPNYLSIQSSKNIEPFTLISNQSSIEALGNNIFRLYPKKLGTDTIKVYANKKMVYSTEFKIDTIPNPVARIGPYLDTILTIAQILSNPYLSVRFPPSNYKGKFAVLGFTTTIKNVKGEMLLFETAGFNKFSDRLIQTIGRLRTGDKLFFEDIKVVGPESRIRTIFPFTTLIK